MTNGDIAMELLAALGGFEVVRPETQESRARLGSALLAASAVGLPWDITRPDTLKHVNTARSTLFAPRTTPQERSRAWCVWQRVVERSRGWIETEE